MQKLLVDPGGVGCHGFPVGDIVTIDDRLKKMLRAPLPGIAQGTATAVLLQHQTVSRVTGALALEQFGAEADAVAVGFNHGSPTQQDGLECPALKPADPERVGHRHRLETGSVKRFMPNLSTLLQIVFPIRNLICSD